MWTNEELALKIQAGEEKYIEQLWKQCYYFIRQQATKWARAWENRPGFDTDDLIQAGYFALVKAVEGYESERGSFIGYFTFYLKTAFSDVIGCRYEGQGKDPLNNSISLDAPASSDEDDDRTVADKTPYEETGFEDVEEELYQEYVSDVVREALDSLPERQNYCVTANYLEGKTYQEIANDMNVSGTRVGQLVKAGLRGLREGSFAPSLAELMYGYKNLYAHTSLGAWKNSGESVQEWTLLYKERKIKQYHLQENRESKIRYCVDVLGMDLGQAEHLFPA